MGWTVYVKKNKEGEDLLKMILQEPQSTFSGIVESFEKASIFSGESYMTKGKKTIKGRGKILRQLIQESKVSRAQPYHRQQQPQASPYDSYDNMMYDTIFSKDQDEEIDEKQAKLKQREEISKRAEEMQQAREKSRPPAKVPKDEPQHYQEEYQDEDALDAYLMNEIKQK